MNASGKTKEHKLVEGLGEKEFLKFEFWSYKIALSKLSVIKHRFLLAVPT
jgi:hypothetical protein